MNLVVQVRDGEYSERRGRLQRSCGILVPPGQIVMMPSCTMDSGVRSNPPLQPQDPTVDWEELRWETQQLMLMEARVALDLGAAAD